MASTVGLSTFDSRSRVKKDAEKPLSPKLLKKVQMQGGARRAD
jgi:hypothetical protein